MGGRRRLHLLVAGGYVVAGLAAWWPSWPFSVSRIPECPCGDAALESWGLMWTPWALLHCHNPFFSPALNIPHGVDTMSNTTMPLLGMLAAPLTLSAGPAASFTFLLWLAGPASATAMYFVLRHWDVRPGVGFAGGLFYGFSPFVSAHGSAHLHLVFVPLPPLILMAAHEALIVSRSPRRWGITLGLLLSCQFLISSEVFAMSLMMLLVGALLLVCARPGVVVSRWRERTHAALWAVGTTAVLVALPAWAELAGPQHTGAVPLAFARQNPFGADLLSAVLPTSKLRFAPHFLARAGDRLATAGDLAETGAYLGVPLLIGATWLALAARRDGWTLLCMALALLSLVFALGPYLKVDATSTSLWMPFRLLDLLPPLRQMEPGRFSLEVDLFLCVGLARAWSFLALDRLGRWRRRAAGAVAAVVLASLVPQPLTRTVPIDAPRFFENAPNRVLEGAVVLTYPLPAPSDAQAMLWQATDSMSFRLVGSYLLVPGKGGVPTLYPPELAPADVEQALEAWQGTPFVALPGSTWSQLVTDTRRFISRWGVNDVVVDPAERGSGTAIDLFSAATGKAPEREGGIDLWVLR